VLHPASHDPLGHDGAQASLLVSLPAQVGSLDQRQGEPLGSGREVIHHHRDLVGLVHELNLNEAPDAVEGSRVLRLRPDELSGRVALTLGIVGEHHPHTGVRDDSLVGHGTRLVGKDELAVNFQQVLQSSGHLSGGERPLVVQQHRIRALHRLGNHTVVPVGRPARGRLRAEQARRIHGAVVVEPIKRLASDGAIELDKARLADRRQASKHGRAATRLNGVGKQPQSVHVGTVDRINIRNASLLRLAQQGFITHGDEDIPVSLGGIEDAGGQNLTKKNFAFGRRNGLHNFGGGDRLDAGSGVDTSSSTLGTECLSKLHLDFGSSRLYGHVIPLSKLRILEH